MARRGEICFYLAVLLICACSRGCTPRPLSDTHSDHPPCTLRPVTQYNIGIECAIDTVNSTAILTFKNITYPIIYLHIRCTESAPGYFNGKQIQNLFPQKHLNYFGLILVDCVLLKLNRNSFKGMDKLTDLEIRNSTNLDIEKETFVDVMNQLDVLELSRIDLLKLPNDLFRSTKGRAPHIRYIYLNYNYFVDIPSGLLMQAPYLQSVSLHDNNFSFIAPHMFEGLAYIQVLELEYNPIEEIVAGTFVNMTKLRYLDMGYNHLRSINSTTFVGLIELDQLFLHDNFIEYIENGSFIHMHYITYISLTHNLLTCIHPDIFPNILGQM